MAPLSEFRISLPAAPSIPPPSSPEPAPAPVVEAQPEPPQQSAFKPLVYVLIIPMLLLALLQWTNLPAWCVHAITGS